MTSNAGRMGDGIAIYKQAMQGFIARSLRRQRGGKGDWFAEWVLPALHGPQRANLEAELARARSNGRIARKGSKGKSGPEQLLEPAHYQPIISVNWRAAFEDKIGDRKALTWMREIGEWRNVWAHQDNVDASDAFRLLDTCYRVLALCDGVAAENILALRDTQDNESDPPDPQQGTLPVPDPQPTDDAKPTKDAVTGLKPWRDVIAPLPDVSSGSYGNAEFAADLQQVVDNRAAPEYGDTDEFFRRTYLTRDMHRLLVEVVRRLRGEGGEPVLDLRTAFGGGKTHTLLAVLHLVRSGAALANRSDIAAIYDEAGGPPPDSAAAVLVGTHLDWVTPSRTADETGGFEINTLWGEMAYQLAGEDGFRLLAEHERQGIAPGADALRSLFELSGPCVVLIDELVAYLRNVPSQASGEHQAGTYGAHITFCQNLTEAAKSAGNVVVLTSIPESRIEFGDAQGAEIAEQVSNVFQRIGAPWQPIGAPWQPVSAEEAFEVVRRRLFGDRIDETERDRTCQAFHDLYNSGVNFPTECREPAYLQRLRSSYPIHPEVFDRLYIDWATNIDRFQRTRGVLRLMADVVHRLWTAKDQDPLIMPASIPLYESGVRQRLVTYLGDAWNGPVDADIDSETCAAGELERENSLFGRIQACRRLSRTIFLGSVPARRTKGWTLCGSCSVRSSPKKASPPTATPSAPSPRASASSTAATNATGSGFSPISIRSPATASPKSATTKPSPNCASACVPSPSSLKTPSSPPFTPSPATRRRFPTTPRPV